MCYAQQSCGYVSKNRQCRVAVLVLYCLRFFILVFGVECVTVSNDMFIAGTGIVQCGMVGVVLCDSLYIVI